MKFSPTQLPGVFIIDIEPITDERGMFARSWCKDEFKQQGLVTDFHQCSISFNQSKGTLRGMHYQTGSNSETKIVRCTQGSIFDVAVDLRPDSHTYKQWFGTLLSAENHRMLYIPQGLAHGFITLESKSELSYQISTPYVPDSAQGIRWDDPCFKIDWPLKPTVISWRDSSYPDFISTLVK